MRFKMKYDEYKSKIVEARYQLIKDVSDRKMDSDWFNLAFVATDFLPGSLMWKLGVKKSLARARKALTIVKNLSARGKLPKDWENATMDANGRFRVRSGEMTEMEKMLSGEDSFDIEDLYTGDENVLDEDDKDGD